MTTIIGNKAYESAKTWPYYTKAYNVTAFQRPVTNMPSAGQSIADRQKMSSRSGLSPSQRGLPQLTWFEGTYDVPALVGKYPEICKYPNLVLYSGGVRKCLEPGKLTAAEEAALRAKSAEAEKHISDYLAANKAQAEQCVEITRDGKKHMAKQVVGGSGANWVDCSTGKILGVAYSIKGLGASESITTFEEEQLSKTKASYRVTEVLLAAAIVAGLFVVLK
jgi:hypothetical protein